jgi:hypothetical protein
LNEISGTSPKEFSDQEKLAYLRSSRYAEAAVRAYKRPAFKKPKKADGFIPIFATGGLGDLIVTLGVSARLSDVTGMPVRIWSNYSSAARAIWDNSSLAGEIEIADDPFPGFDYSVRVNCIAAIDLEKNFKRFESPKFDSIYLANQGIVRQTPWSHFVRFHPQLDGEVATAAIENGLTRETLPYWMLGLKYTGVYKIDFDEEPFPGGGISSPYITVHDGYDISVDRTRRATKTWDLKLWARSLFDLKRKFPSIKIVQIGAKNSRQIPFVDVNLIGRTPLPQALRIVQNSTLHIDGDSGFVHAAAHMGVPCVAMFGPTPGGFFGYPSNRNISVGGCHSCFWTKETWLVKCPLGKETPACMDAILPDRIVREASEILSIRL